MPRRNPKRSNGGAGGQIEQLLRRMTIEEKSAQLSSAELGSLIEGRRVSEEKCRHVIANGIGQISRVGGDTDLGPQEIADATQAIQDFLTKKSRLGIPAIVHEECCSGYMAKSSTMFPQAIAMAATWNPSLVSGICGTIRKSMRAAGIHQGLAPLLDVARDPRWGRIEETFGEDEYLVASIGSAYVKGLQGPDLTRGVIATAKHFAAYGIPDGGRNIASVRVGPRELRDVYLLPFEAAVKTAALGSLMNAYHELDGIPCVAHRELLTEILRDQWGFDGIVVSDYGAVEMLRTWHMAARDRKEAAKMALEAGIDIELNTTECYGAPLVEAVRAGFISEKTVDEAVRRVLHMKSRLGLFEKPGPLSKRVTVSLFDSPANRGLAFKAAAEAITLLKNDNKALPLGRDVKSIAAVGPYADCVEAMLGDYSYMSSMSFWRKAQKDYSALRIVTALEGIRRYAGKRCKVTYARGCEPADQSKDLFEQAVKAAAGADVVVAVMGEDSFVYCGEMKDRDDLRLLGVQEELIRELASTGVKVVLVLLNGRPLALSGVEKYCAAVVEAWYPGEEGGNAIASVLFGETNPSGKLPASFPENVGQIPVHYSRKPLRFRGYVPANASDQPRYPFGHGLSYTEFAYEALEISPEKAKAGGVVRIGATVTNTGAKEGMEVVQLYVRDVAASLARPTKQLKGFVKVALAAGERKKVEFELGTELFAFTGVDMNLVIEGGRFDVMVGSSSEDIRLRGSFEVQGDRILKARSVFFSQAKVTKA